MVQEIKLELEDSWGEIILAPVSKIEQIHTKTVYYINKKGDNTFHVSEAVDGGTDVRISKVTVSPKLTVVSGWMNGKHLENYSATLIKIHRGLVEEEGEVHIPKKIENPTPKVPKEKKERKPKEGRSSFDVAEEILKEFGPMARVDFNREFKSRGNYTAPVNMFINGWGDKVVYEDRILRLSGQIVNPKEGLREIKNIQ
jgi:hypothetical protein